MSLEKLLIFGFALAVLMSLAILADDTSTIREEQNTGYKEKIDELVEKTR